MLKQKLGRFRALDNLRVDLMLMVELLERRVVLGQDKPRVGDADQEWQSPPPNKEIKGREKLLLNVNVATLVSYGNKEKNGLNRLETGRGMG